MNWKPYNFKCVHKLCNRYPTNIGLNIVGTWCRLSLEDLTFSLFCQCIREHLMMAELTSTNIICQTFSKHFSQMAVYKFWIGLAFVPCFDPSRRLVLLR
jgi:hypothetical protein